MIILEVHYMIFGIINTQTLNIDYLRVSIKYIPQNVNLKKYITNITKY